MELFEEIFKNAKTMAVIGLKDNETEAAYRIPYYMQQHGYKIYPVNPKLNGKTVMGENVYPSVLDITDEIDLVNIFRRPDFLVEHSKEILQMDPLPKYVWFQLGIYNDEAAKMLEENGIKVVQNRCIMVEHAHLQ